MLWISQKEPKCENKKSFEKYISEFKLNYPDLPDCMFSMDEDEQEQQDKQDKQDKQDELDQQSKQDDRVQLNGEETAESSESQNESEPENGDTDIYSFLEDLQEEEIGISNNTIGNNNTNGTMGFSKEKGKEYTNKDIIRILEDPNNLSTEEKSWLMDQNCETEEEVLIKSRELLQARNKEKGIK